MATTPNPRLLAARTLARVIAQGDSLATVFDGAINQLPPTERGLFQEFCYGTLRRFHQLDAISQQLLDKPLRRKDSDVQALLLLGLYQLVHMRIPDHAVLSETVSAAKKLKKPWAAGLINGVLRQYQRQADTIASKLEHQAEARFSHPQWFVDRVEQAWPQWQPLLDANNQQPPLTLRVNTARGSRDEYLQQLAAREITAVACEHSPVGIRLESPVEVTALPGFAQGAVSVQDEAAQLAVPLLDLQPGQRVLDACAAPGGKSCHILENEPNIAELVCIEQDSARMPRIGENLQRLGLSGRARLVEADASDLQRWWDGRPFDRILLDAPCSATGVIRRHPDIKLLRRDSDLVKLAALQRQLLEALWQVLAPGGLLLYATCSVLPEENEQQVSGFIDARPDAHHQPIGAAWGETRPFGTQLFPQTGGHDGFYYARIYKSA